jgi:hypothetical protein
MTRKTWQTYELRVQTSSIVRILGELEIWRKETIPKEYWVIDWMMLRLEKFSDLTLAQSHCLKLHYQKIDHSNLMTLKGV